MSVDDQQFQTLLEQVQELHRRTDELTRSKTRIHENIRARLNWSTPPSSLPGDQRDVADAVVEALGNPRLSSAESRRLYQTYFRK